MNKVDNKEYQQLIRNNAKLLIDKSGVKGLNMMSLAKMSGVAKQTLYTMVGNKEKLLQAILNEEMSMKLKFFEDLIVNEENPLQAFKKIVDDVPKRFGGFTRRFAKEIKEFYPQIDREMSLKQQENETLFVDFLKKCQKLQLISKKYEPDFIVRVFRIIIESFLLSNINEAHFIDYSRKAMLCVLDGIVTDEYKEIN